MISVAKEQSTSSLSIDSGHNFIPASPGDSRAPCPALNALANHGYLPRSGRTITPFRLLGALISVYNVSLPLALFVVIPGFLTCGTLHLLDWPWNWSLTLDLDSLAAFGPRKIAHPASLVHPNYPSHRPDPKLLAHFLSLASHPIPHDNIAAIGDTKISETGLRFSDLVQVRVIREASLAPEQRLSSLHRQIALGEAALTWLIMRTLFDGQSSQDKNAGIIPRDRLQQWFGQERLPDGWWQFVRPSRAVGLIEARMTAGKVRETMDVARNSGSTLSRGV